MQYNTIYNTMCLQILLNTIIIKYIYYSILLMCSKYNDKY